MFKGLTNTFKSDKRDDPLSTMDIGTSPHEVESDDLDNPEITHAEFEKDSEDRRSTVVDFTKLTHIQDKINEAKDVVKLVENLRAVHEEIVKCLVSKCNSSTLQSIFTDYMNVRKKIKHRTEQLKTDGYSKAAKDFYNETRKIRELIYTDICTIINEDLVNISSYERTYPSMSMGTDRTSYCSSINRSAQYFYSHIYGYGPDTPENEIMKYRDESISQFIEPHSDLQFLHNKCLRVPYKDNSNFALSRNRDFLLGTSKVKRAIASEKSLQKAGKKQKRTNKRRGNTKRKRNTKRRR
jgi:hypothetical protein